jgi:hypothetical protein
MIAASLFCHPRRALILAAFLRIIHALAKNAWLKIARLPAAMFPGWQGRSAPRKTFLVGQGRVETSGRMGQAVFAWLIAGDFEGRLRQRAARDPTSRQAGACCYSSLKKVLA